MYHWPLTFSLMGFTSVLSIVTLFLLYRMVRSQVSGDRSRGVSSPTTLDQYGDLSDSSGGEEEADVEEEGVEEVRSRDTRMEGEDDETTLRRRTVLSSGGDVKESDKETSDKEFAATVERLMEF